MGQILNESGSDAMESDSFLWRGRDGRLQKTHVEEHQENIQKLIQILQEELQTRAIE
jgi:hypothetical protein